MSISSEGLDQLLLFPLTGEGDGYGASKRFGAHAAAMLIMRISNDAWGYPTHL